MEVGKIFDLALSYTEYREQVDKLLASGKTTGNNQSEQLTKFTTLNVQRMNRLDKTVDLPDSDLREIENLKKQFKWLLIGEAWCGDCAQLIPLINKVAAASRGEIQLRITSKDAHPELIEKYSTNGSKSIPKLLLLNKDTNEVICTWGPRPKPAQEIMLNWKSNNNEVSWDEFEKDLHLWYARDKGATTIKELINLLKTCKENIMLQL